MVNQYAKGNINVMIGGNYNDRFPEDDMWEIFVLMARYAPKAYIERVRRDLRKFKELAKEE